MIQGIAPALLALALVLAPMAGLKADPAALWQPPRAGTSLTLAGQRPGAASDGYITQQIARVDGDRVQVVETGGPLGPVRVTLYRGLVPVRTEPLSVEGLALVAALAESDLAALWPLAIGRQVSVTVTEQAEGRTAPGIESLLVITVDSISRVPVGLERLECWRLSLVRSQGLTILEDARVDWCPAVGLVTRAEVRRPGTGEMMRLIPIEVAVAPG